MNHIEKADRESLRSIIDNIAGGKYVVPDFQREFTWQPWDISSLVKSIFKDYYIGTLLLWTSTEDNFSTLSCEPLRGFSKTLDPTYIVLDGQQRLTAMHYAFFSPAVLYPGRKKRCFFELDMIDFASDRDEEAFNYQWGTKAYLQEHLDEAFYFDRRVMPLHLLSRSGYDVYDWFARYKSYWTDKLTAAEKTIEQAKYLDDNGDLLNEAEGTIARARQSIEAGDIVSKTVAELHQKYQISYITLAKKMDIAKVCDIFTHINSKGVQLSIFDLLNALLKPKGVMLKHMWREASPSLVYGDKGKMNIYVLQVMSIVLQNYCSPKFLYYLVPGSSKQTRSAAGKSVTELITNKDHFVEAWDSAVQYLQKSINLLSSSKTYGAIKSDYIPYSSILPVFASMLKYLDEYGGAQHTGKMKMSKWYWASILMENYSGSSESTSASDYIAFKAWIDDDEKVMPVYTKLLKDFDSIDFIPLTSKGAALYNSVLNLLALNDAKDWMSDSLPEHEALDDHHIVPKSWCNKLGLSNMNSVMNRTLLRSETNRLIIRDQHPAQYLESMKQDLGVSKFYDVMESHFISRDAIDYLTRDDLDQTSYDGFLKERQRSIKAFIKSRFISVDRELPLSVLDLNESIDKVEVALRDLLALHITSDNYSARVKPHIQEGIQRRIDTEVRKTSATIDDFFSVRAKFDLLNVQDYSDLITSNWDLFDTLFSAKSVVKDKMTMLSDCRNAIKHGRPLKKEVELAGRSAIAYFESTLRI